MSCAPPEAAKFDRFRRKAQRYERALYFQGRAADRVARHTQ
jgi:hypothetical protein